ncbi:MAG TPA: BON domain-containing protein, partial [Blastocatellia bacterium]|nr:BON domain-containing protein [Blastocatellia bacterium]
MTKRTFVCLSILMLISALSFSAFAQDPAPAKPTKTAKAKAPMPMSDADIQKCISDKLAMSKTITGGSATVSGGIATLTGEASSGGAKGGVTKTARACGAKSVTNNITVTPKAK